MILVFSDIEPSHLNLILFFDSTDFIFPCNSPKCLSYRIYSGQTQDPDFFLTKYKAVSLYFILFFYFFFFNCLYIYSYVYTMFGPSLPPSPNLHPLPLPPHLLPGRTSSAFLFSNFVEEKT
jgi:hypothetical protein